MNGRRVLKEFAAAGGDPYVLFTFLAAPLGSFSCRNFMPSSTTSQLYPGLLALSQSKLMSAVVSPPLPFEPPPPR